MKNKLLLILLVLFFTPTLSTAAVTRTLEIEFAFTSPDILDTQLLGYRLYKEGQQACETSDPIVSTISCDILSEDGTFNFSLTAYYANGTESPQSPSFSFTIGSAPVTLPPDPVVDPIVTPPPNTTGSNTITYSWDNNSLIASLTGFKMYMNDTLLCETQDLNATSFSCNADLINSPMAFSITTFDSIGTESLKSNILLLDPADYPDIIQTPEPLRAVINPTPANGEIPLNASFSGIESTGDIASYNWEFGDGTTSTGYLAYHTYSISATYTATLQVVDQIEATHQVSTTITALPSTVVPQPPTAVFSSSTADGNAPNVVDFDGTSSTTTNPPIVYSWNFGDGTTGSGQTTQHTYTNDGTFTVSLEVTDDKGLTNSVDTPIIIIGTVEPNVKPTALISTHLPGGDAPITISFDGSKSSDPDGTITGYSWNFGDGSTPGSGQTTQHTYTYEGIYTVSLLVTDDKGDTATATSQVACNVTLPALELNIEVGEVSIDHNWVRVLFENSFSQPIVVAGPPSSDDVEPVLIRIRNIDQQGFEVRLQEWDYQDGSHAPETFSYIAMEKGTFTLDNGAKIESGIFTGSNRSNPVNLQQTYGLNPIILTQIITENSAKAVTGRLSNINTISFDYLLQEEQLTAKKHPTESVNYIAIEPGKGEIANLLYEADITSDSVTQDWSDLTFLTEFPDLPFFIAGMQTKDGTDPATVRNQSMSQLAIQIKIEEEQSKDTEIDHTTEVVGYIAIGSKTAATEPPATPTSAEKKFTFTWDYGDTQNVSAFRFYLNGSLLSESTNPDEREITCYAPLLNETMVFTMTALFLDGTEGMPSNLLTLNPADYPELFGIRLVTFNWEYDDSLESSINGFRIYNNEQLVCETTDPTARQISCKTATQFTVNNFSIVAIELSGTETISSNDIQYNP